MQTFHVISYTDLVIFLIIFSEYVFFRIANRKQIREKYIEDEEEAEIVDHYLQAIITQIEDFSLRIQKIDERLRTHIEDKITETNMQMDVLQESVAIINSRIGLNNKNRDITELQCRIREMASDVRSLWRFVEVPKQMLHLRPN